MPEGVVAVYRQAFLVGAVRGALGAGLRAESTVEVAADLAAGFMADREDDPGGDHLRLQISAGGQQSHAIFCACRGPVGVSAPGSGELGKGDHGQCPFMAP